MLYAHPLDSLSNGTPFRPIGTILVESGRINADDMRRVLDYQKKHSLLFGEAAVRLCVAGKKDIERALAAQFDYPYIDTDKIRLMPDIVIAHQPFSPAADAMRKIRTQIALQWNHFQGARSSEGEAATLPHPTFAIVGASEGEGCSYFAANLAVSMAQLGKKTLLIDGDMRCGRIHTLFGLTNQTGLSNILGGRLEKNSIVDINQIPLLSIMTSGTVPPNPTELISRDRMHALIERLRADYDVVIIDTPPLGTNLDAEIYGRLAGHAIIVTRKDEGRFDRVRQLVASLKKLNVSITGSVLNQAD